jgi:hypothetical protein
MKEWRILCVRSQSGELEVIASVLETIRDGQGDYVTLNKAEPLRSYK